MNDPIRYSLRREASADAPAFSSDLHGRVMRGVRESRLEESTTTPPSIFRLIVAAAALTAVIAAVTWRLIPAPPTTVPPAKAVTLAPIDRLLTGAHPARWTFDEPTPAGMAYLDQDAKSFGRFVMQQLAALPGARTKPAPAENTGG